MPDDSPSSVSPPSVGAPDPELRSIDGLLAFALGSNVGDSRSTLAWAVGRLRSRYGPLRVAPLYCTAPISHIEQDPFFNTVVLGSRPLGSRPLDDDESDLELRARRAVAFAKGLEHEAGRRRGPKDGPRPLDVDLLFWGVEAGRFGVLDRVEPGLWPGAVEIPHPRLTERRFVLAPLADLAPELRLVVQDEPTSIAELLAAVADQAVERVSWEGGS